MLDTAFSPIPLFAAGALADLRAAADAADQAVAWLPLLALAGIVAVGLALWALGGRFVKPSVVLVASAAGGYAGFTLGKHMDPAIGPWVGLLLGLTAGAAVGHWLFRMAAGVLLAAFLAIAAPTGAAVALDYDLAARAQAIVDAVRDAATSEDERDTPTLPDGATRSLVDADSPAEGDDEALTARGVVARAGAWMAGFLTDAAEGGEEIWNELEPEEQRTIVAAGAIGALAGLAVGVIFPTVAMAVLTAGLGGAAMLGAGSSLASMMNPEWRASMPESPIAWAAIWVSVSLLGVVLQLAPHRKRRRKPASDDSSEG